MIEQQNQTNTPAEDIRHLLAHNIVSLRFTKKDGTLRDMRATTSPEVVVPHQRTTTGVRAKKPSNLISVWDVDLAAWRTLDINGEWVWFAAEPIRKWKQNNAA